MATYYTLLTKTGQARIANAVALNQKVNLTYMAVGDGNGNPTTPNENQTALVREKYRATINQLTVDPDNPNYLVAELIIPTNVGGWSIYEVGVFDDQNQLIAVANFPATYKPELVEGSGRDLIVRIIIQVSNTSVVTLKIDPAITLASQAWVAANYVKKITVAGGTTGQVLVKKSNANEDFQWVDPTAAVDVNVFSREETQTVATGQTIINLAQLTTDGAAIYIEGIRLRDDQFTVNSPTRLTLATSYPAGTKLTIVQNEETSRNAFMLKANNLSDINNREESWLNLRPLKGLSLYADPTDDLDAVTKRWSEERYAKRSNNLSDLLDKATSRENLGLKSAAMREVGTGPNQIPDMNSFSSGPGWMKFPSGKIIQYGYQTSSASGAIIVNFPIPFPTQCYGVTGAGTDANAANIGGCQVIDRFGFNLSAWLVGSGVFNRTATNISWIAFGV
ncbi:hypothetical protein [Salmonella phage PT1]|nr:hypothetical protein [Salmonella phage PT1]